ncbi:RICIN domain-containing protein [Kitasatospora sp. SUK 42]|uniref:RICIN domain-containing protein n=1 Tax=Kitasatospora sp. SUK 42 TaxID=1588882 RepID=UPI0018C9AD18|nr:RICIN domain-containing protein [Kitasatospora sp. SUK 42]MBV2154927.1 RICIN domain-containing protein [Kitasatospora sp. SUK 42]
MSIKHTQSSLIQTPHGGPRRAPNRALAVLGTSLALGLGLLGTPSAAAGPGPADGTPAPIVPVGPAPARTPEQQALLDALTTAKSTGKPVTVETMTTEASKTVANPNGTLTTTDNSAPVRTKRSDGWADLDATLRANPDGTLSPAVASTALTFSGGGNGPMATVATDDGKRLAVEAPFALPKPTLNGDTATYPDVLPGVDLQLTALPVGGWRDVIVVRSAEAAANPALKTLRFPLKAEGLTVSATESGSVEVKDDKGGLRFRSPSPLQWDSSRPVSAVAAARLAAAAHDPETPPATPASSVEGPGDGANVAAIATRVVGGALELTPDQGALRSGTGPWYLDPTLASVASYSEGSVQVQENYKTAENYNKKTDLSTGYCGYHSSDPRLNCAVEGRERAYFQFRINPAIYTKPAGAEFPPTVFTSTLNGQVSDASSMDTPTDLGVYAAPRDYLIHEHSNWNDQPCGTNGNLVMNGCTYVGGQQIKGTGPLAVNVTGAIQQVAAGQQSIWTVGIAPQATEWEKLYRHKIASNLSIATTYDITPTVWYPRTSPGPGFADTRRTAECTSGGAHPWDNPGWVGNNQNINLIVNSWSPTGQSLYTGFHMWDDNDPNFSLLDGGWGGSYNDPGYSQPVGSLSDGHQYGWYAKAADGALTSPSSAWCYFRVDRTAPRVSISSPDFPPSGTPNDHPTRFAMDTQPGTFVLNAEDPAPGPGLWASGVACTRFSTDPTPVVGWQCGQSGTYRPGETVKFTPTRWGTNTVYAWAMDIAGNYSQRADYSFYAPWKPGSVPVFGDTDGDQLADIVIADAGGNLRTIAGNADPMRAITAAAASAPRNGVNDTTTTWADYQITHRGTLNEAGTLDQLIVHNTKDANLKKNLYLIDNDGTGRYDVYQKTPLTRPKSTACAAVPTSGVACPDSRPFAADWSQVSQIVALGTPDGELTSTTPATPTNPAKTSIISQTSLLTVEGGRLWLHNVSEQKWNDVSSTALLIPTAPNSGTWDDYELINPGPANGTTSTIGKPATRQATLWARHRTNGNIYAYPLGFTADGQVDFSTLTKPNSGTVILSGANWTVAAQPKVGAADLNGDGYPDLWAINNNNAITVFPGKSSIGNPGKVDGFDNWQLLGYANASVSLHSNQVPWQCVDAEGGPRNGADVAAYACWETINQRFTLGIDGTIRASGYCLTAKNASLGNGVQVGMAVCDNQPTQKWATTPEGRIYLPATVSPSLPGGRCLERPGWAADQGIRLGIWDCIGANVNQLWTVTPESKP